MNEFVVYILFSPKHLKTYSFFIFEKELFMTKKSWEEKFYRKPDFKIKVIDRSFWGYVKGSKMLIPSPKIIQDYLNQSDEGLIPQSPLAAPRAGI